MIKTGLKYRQMRRGINEEEIKKLALEMKHKNQMALTIDMSRLVKKDLSFLIYFKHLTHLSISQSSSSVQINKIKYLDNLIKLSLLSVRVNNYSFLEVLTKLEILDIRLGSSKDFSAIAKLTKLKALSFLSLRSLDHLSFLTTMYGLQYLYINSCKNITGFPNIINITNLKRVHLETMNSLISIEGLTTSLSIQELIIINSKKLVPNDFKCFIGHPTLKKILPGIATIKSKKLKDVYNMFPDKIIDRFYGTKNDNFMLE